MQMAWVIRAGENRAGTVKDAHHFFMTRNMIALSDSGLGDLSLLSPQREAFYTAYRKVHPHDSTHGSSSIAKGKYFRFVHEVQSGDYVLYLSVKEQRVYVATIVSGYRFDESEATRLPHQREVQWKWVFPKQLLTDDGQGELGAARTFYQYKRHIDEVQAILDGGKAVPFKEWRASLSKHT